jgi:hypothetical protein
MRAPRTGVRVPDGVAQGTTFPHQEPRAARARRAQCGRPATHPASSALSSNHRALTALWFCCPASTIDFAAGDGLYALYTLDRFVSPATPRDPVYSFVSLYHRSAYTPTIVAPLRIRIDAIIYLSILGKPE